MNPNSYPDGIFALIIGIDKYKAKDFTTLKGAVNDAEAFRRFLIDDLGVDRSHIEILKNEQAKRATILSKFSSHLLNNERIPAHGKAAKIFFFAGHGSRIESPGNRLPSDGKVEVICPFDERTFIGRDYVHAIPDFVLAQNLHQLAQKKGNNIIVILDSCHSGGMARDAVNVAVRSPDKPSPALPLQVIQHDAQNYDLWTPSTSTHILLAACDQGGRAYETSFPPFYGYFTRALIPALRAIPRTETTYVNLIETLPKFSAASQIPHCGGTHKNRVVFTMNHPLPGIRTLPVRVVHIFMVRIERDVNVRPGKEYQVRRAGQEFICSLVARMVTEDQAVLATQDGKPFNIPNGSYVVLDKDRRITARLVPGLSYHAFLIQAGSFEGIRKGMYISIRAPHRTLPAGHLSAHIVGIGQTLLISLSGRPSDIPDGSRAVVHNWKDKVSVYVPSDFIPQLFPLASDELWKYGRAKSYHVADIALGRQESTILIERRRTKNSSIVTRFTLTPNIRLASAIDGVAHFHHFLEHRPTSTELSDFRLEMHRLEGKFPHRVPINGQNCIRSSGRNFHRAEIKSGKTDKYGFTILNATKQDLFPYLFYFDYNKYTINVSIVLFEPPEYGIDCSLALVRSPDRI
ncbi:caspase domain-containing protein [Mycena rosella]|uniref:Caspase domain-containing protein n=1 Tax=Mycena rosella TaxID=1033263 RepID=A0AAD7GLF9_MYCRO|nr:caspase domain-containing protein [Mycena rosella]